MEVVKIAPAPSLCTWPGPSPATPPSYPHFTDWEVVYWVSTRPSTCGLRKGPRAHTPRGWGEGSGAPRPGGAPGQRETAVSLLSCPPRLPEATGQGTQRLISQAGPTAPSRSSRGAMLPSAGSLGKRPGCGRQEAQERTGLKDTGALTGTGRAVDSWAVSRQPDRA